MDSLKFNKQKAYDFLIQKVQKELDGLKGAYKSSHEYTTDEEAQAKSKWDTQSIEAGYLAGAQKVRVDELEQELNLLEESEIREFNQEETVEIGSIVCLETNEKIMYYFLLATAGGEMITVDGNVLITTTVFSPLGQELIGMNVGDEFEVETPKENRLYKIVSQQ
jgi:transcription elongation GreA/GreB family factor